jgi:hypothetical protein
MTNPLHQVSPSQPIDPRFLFELTGLFYETFLLWANHYGLKDEVKPILDKYTEKLKTTLITEPEKEEKK